MFNYSKTKWCLALYVIIALHASSALAAEPGSERAWRNRRGQRAIEVLADRLPAVAAKYGKSAEKLRELFLQNNDLWLDPADNLFYACGFELPEEGLPESPVKSLPAQSIVPLEQTFKLHSVPGSLRVIYLDFDGHVTKGTIWNSSFNSGQDIVSDPFNFEGSSSSFTDAELDRIQYIWARVAEDFAAYNVDVTTEDPGVAALRNDGTSGDKYGIRMVISASSSWYPYSAGGVCYVGAFKWSSDTPGFVFPNRLGNGNEKYTAECISHETGHGLGLNHDGKTDGTEYYRGHGVWAPIMGNSYGKTITQWSKGEYAGANNKEDDLAIFVNTGADYMPDDHGGTNNTATPITLGSGGIDAVGVIEKRTDVDVFSFSAAAGSITINVDLAEPAANLDACAHLENSSGMVIASSDPTGLPAILDATLEDGKHYLHVWGTGTGDPTTGYSDYASIGQYFISGNVTTPQVFDLDVSPTETVEFAGPQGGPFGPDNVVYTLTNSGNSPLLWSAAESAGWLDLSSVQGTLAAGGQTTVEATLTSQAALLPAGTYVETITFIDSSNSVTYERDVRLEIYRTPGTEDPVLLDDNFDDGDYAGWIIIDEGTAYAPSEWSAQSGVMVQSSNIYAGSTSGSEITKLGTYTFYDADSVWTNYRIDMTVRSQDDDAIGVMFRYQDTNNYYRFSWDRSRSYRRLVKKKGGVFTLLAEDVVPYATGQTYQLEIIAQDDLLQVFIDDSIVFAVTDADLNFGTIALYTWGNAGSYFDNVLVTLLSGDNFPPTISSVTATPSNILDTETSQLKVDAVDPDSGPEPLIYNWIVRSGEGTLDGPSIDNPVYTPPDVTATQTFTLTVEVSDGQALTADTVDITVNDGDSPLLLDDNFDDRDYAGWTIVDEGTAYAPSVWSAESGVMVQTSNIYGGSTYAGEITKLGTYAFYHAGSTWTDYRIDMTIRSQDDDAIGVMFRYQDSDNYYRFSWDRSRKYRRLVKKKDGVFTLLDEDSVQYATGQTYELRVIAQGASLQVFIDGDAAFSTTDADLTFGTIALYTWGNAGSYFDDVVVTLLSGGNIPPKISSITATPSSILDTQKSQLQVDAVDPDSGPEPLSYKWIVRSGEGTLDNPAIPNPVYTPPNVAISQVFTLTVEVSDGEYVTIGTVDLAVENADSALLLDEDFHDGDYAGWIVVDEGTKQPPSDWSAASGAMVQNSNIYSTPTAAADLPKLGTYAYYDPGSAWVNYQVDMTIRSEDDDAIGVMFRYQDSDNYYRFSWDKSRSYRRLVKKKEGVFTLLAEDSVQYVTGRTYQLRIIARDTSLQVLIDGSVVLSAKDGDLDFGTIALYTWGNVGSYFDDIVVMME
ncbi:MAG: family 16 glycoside hydrolase [Planctomycetota bacterium]|jgi:hypothetical protein